MEDYNTRCAHPYRWTYTGEPLVRATPFSQTDRQRRHSRAWLSSRPQKFDRALMPTRPYRRNDELEGADSRFVGLRDTAGSDQGNSKDSAVGTT